jgi:hypothetical protein
MAFITFIKRPCLLQNSGKSLGGLVGRFTVGVDDDPAVAQVFIERDFGDAQALGNLVDAELLLAVERLGHNCRALGFVREAPAAADPAPRPGRGQPGVGALAN